MITLDEAKRLKAAGFPQVQTGRVIKGRDDTFGLVCRYVAPNSDELIAAIQERWGLSLRAIFRELYALTDNFKSEHTLLSALVGLYCKLAEGEE